MALNVIGAGLGRTGTLSLKLALERLGCGPCYHMTEIMSEARIRLPQWLAVVRGAPDWDAIFEGFAATVDYPTCTWWRELAAYYPDAKLILSDRDAEDWYRSVRGTILSDEAVARFSDGPVGEFMQGAILDAFEGRLADRDFMLAWYERRRAEIIAALPSQRLLIHRSAEGWEPLCAFLGLPVPDVPYPRVNSREDMQAGVGTVAESDAPAIPNTPEMMEAGMKAYLESMNRLAWG